MSSVMDLTDKIKIIDSESPISTGGFSKVFIGIYTIDQHATEMIAVKKLAMTKFKAKSATECALRLRKRQRLAREVRVWKDLDHPNIVRLLGVYMGQPDTIPGMAMPWYRHGSASNYLLTRRFSVFERFNLLIEIACGLAYLHTRSQPIVHGDLKAQNVLIDDGGHAMLCDFGISRIIDELSGPTGTTTSGIAEGTLRWSAPEVVSGEDPKRFTPESDVWSFGCTGYEIFTGELPYYEYRTTGSVVMKIGKGETPTWPADVHHDDDHEDIPGFVTNFISSRWELDPKERGKMDEIVDEMQFVLPLLSDKIDQTDDGHYNPIDLQRHIPEASVATSIIDGFIRSEPWAASERRRNRETMQMKWSSTLRSSMEIRIEVLTLPPVPPPAPPPAPPPLPNTQALPCLPRIIWG